MMNKKTVVYSHLILIKNHTMEENLHKILEELCKSSNVNKP